MPRTWPMEALKAQAVAARSYALAHMRYPDPTGEELGYQLCATDACQVYPGMGVSAGPYGDRWRSAVELPAGPPAAQLDRRTGALVRRPAGRHALLLDLERTDRGERVRVRNGPTSLSQACHRRRRRFVAAVPLARHDLAGQHPAVPVRGRRVERRTPRVSGHQRVRCRAHELVESADPPVIHLRIPARHELVGVLPRSIGLSRDQRRQRDVAPADRSFRLVLDGHARRARGARWARMGPRGRDGPVGGVRQGPSRADVPNDPGRLLRRAQAGGVRRTGHDPGRDRHGTLGRRGRGHRDGHGRGNDGHLGTLARLRGQAAEGQVGAPATRQPPSPP